MYLLSVSSGVGQSKNVVGGLLMSTKHSFIKIEEATHLPVYHRLFHEGDELGLGWDQAGSEFLIACYLWPSATCRSPDLRSERFWSSIVLTSALLWSKISQSHLFVSFLVLCLSLLYS